MRVFRVSESRITFAEPTSEFLLKIRRYLLGLNLVHEAELPALLKSESEEESRLGSLDDVLSKLSGALKADYEENISEVAEAPWTFDYIVESDGYKGLGLSILTRLRSSDPSQGNILYGSQVYRLHEDEFMYWIEDPE